MPNTQLLALERESALIRPTGRRRLGRVLEMRIPCELCGASKQDPLEDCAGCGWTLTDLPWVEKGPAPTRRKPE